MVPAIDETLTTTPPLPPRLVDMRRAASRQHSIRPTVFTVNSLSRAAASKSATRAVRPMPALFTRWVTGPNAFSAASNSCTMSASRETSAGRATAWPPLAAMSATTFLACASRER